MNLKTEIKLPSYPFTLSHQEGIVSFGSCFSENIGEKLAQHKFNSLVNPFGILFNPISISKAIEDCILNTQYTASDLQQNNDLHFSLNHHSKYSGSNQAEVLTHINTSISDGSKALKSAKTIILTFGTAWVYKLKESNEVVANCYKLPSSLFTKKLLSISEIVAEVSSSLTKLRLINPEVKIITTISPVRHWKDGVVENQQSKATLHLAIKELREQHENLVYFPSYEIMLDELRDYRFYADDMLHPSSLAIDYIWQKFADAFFSPETKELNKRISHIEKEKNHKPFNPQSNDFIAFKKKLEEKEKELYLEFPYLKK
ncbi:MAG: GSCFA domain-containing protein [Flavobacteriales bacterium]